MAYRKRPLTTRTCVHCHEAYQAVDRRRLYCSDSCKVQACKAKRRRRLVAKDPVLAAPALLSDASTSPAASAHTLDWNWQNIAVLGTAAALGNLGVKVGERVVGSLQQPSPAARPAVSTPQLVDPLSWLPAGLLTANAPRVPLELSTGGRSVLFVELRYLGHLLYYQPSQRLLLWRAAPGKLAALRGPDDVAFIAEQIPCDTYGGSSVATLGSGSGLQTLG